MLAEQEMENEIKERLDGHQFNEAFELLVERFQDKVFRLAFSMLRNETHAEDVAQDVFVRIWKGLPRYHGGSSVSTWVYTITRNACLTELKKNSARPALYLSEPSVRAAADEAAGLVHTPQNPGDPLDVPSALAELPEKYRAVVILFYLEGRAYHEVATMLGIPLGTVKTLLFRAKRELLRIGSRPSRMTKGPESVVKTGPQTKPQPGCPPWRCVAARLS